MQKQGQQTSLQLELLHFQMRLHVFGCALRRARPLAVLDVNVPVEANAGPWSISTTFNLKSQEIVVGLSGKTFYAKPMLELKNISRDYKLGETVHALNNVDLTINEGEFVAIIGPSGCGKSTLLNILGVLDTPNSGEYLIQGQRADRLSRKQRARLRNEVFGFVFQSFNLLPRTSAYDNVMLPLKYRRGNSRDEKVRAVLENVGLFDRRQSKPNQLSGGQQQRVAIARALVTKPKVILADEPTGNLDTKTGLEIMDLFQKIHRTGTTIIMVTHNTELLPYATRVISMKDGQIVNDERKIHV